MLTVSPTVRLPILLIQVRLDPRLGRRCADMLSLAAAGRSLTEISDALGMPARTVQWWFTKMRTMGVVYGQLRNLRTDGHPDPIPNCGEAHSCLDWHDRVTGKGAKHATLLHETRNSVTEIRGLPCTDFKRALMEVALAFDGIPSHAGARVRKETIDTKKESHHQTRAGAREDDDDLRRTRMKKRSSTEKMSVTEVNHVLKKQGYLFGYLGDEQVLIQDLEPGVGMDVVKSAVFDRGSDMPKFYGDRRTLLELHDRMSDSHMDKSYRSVIRRFRELTVPPHLIVAFLLNYPLNLIKRKMVLSSNKSDDNEAGYFIRTMTNTSPFFDSALLVKTLTLAGDRQWGLYSDSHGSDYGSLVIAAQPQAEEQAEPDANDL